MRHTFLMLLIIASLALPSMLEGQQSAPSIVATQTAVPDWLTWKVFHQSLNRYSEKSTAKTTELFKEQFGVAAKASPAVLALGQSFVATLDRIDADAKKELDRRYGMDLPPLPSNVIERFASKGVKPPRRTLKLRPGKTLRQMAIDDGLDAEFTRQKEAALARHLTALRQVLGSSKVDRMNQFVFTKVRPNVKRFDLDPQPVRR